jgi:hypothetical protein
MRLFGKWFPFSPTAPARPRNWFGGLLTAA